MVVIIDWNWVSCQVEKMFSTYDIRLSLQREMLFIQSAINIFRRTVLRSPVTFVDTTVLFQGLSLEAVIDLQFHVVSLYRVIYDNLPDNIGSTLTVEKTTRSLLYLRLH